MHIVVFLYSREKNILFPKVNIWQSVRKQQRSKSSQVVDVENVANLDAMVVLVAEVDRAVKVKATSMTAMMAIVM